MNVLKTTLAAAGLLAIAGLAHAQSAKPDEIIRSATESAREQINENYETYKTDRHAFYTMIDETVVPRFDVKYISQLVLARNYRSATPEQRSRFTDAFQTMIVRSYADALLEYYDDVDIEWAPLRMAEDATDASVGAKIMRNNGQPIPLDFRVHKTDDGDWKIYDIAVENISVVSNFRAQFAQEVKKNGLDSLIAKLENLQIKAPTVEVDEPAQSS
ncbi:ABC transporter substrate-binding protein [Algiphilus sp. W345]|uniref:ABC transporter substrate-binding protein n=1 Tax=Banduia mediterranea TaxID=3075609 RepID=A0ABU2WHU1_9GAMM|nr:ABC transporter substrate-binding protein [Algiphilus sp. W345]MDT0497445.1 ABC transporter substrate-binding protein [Algiphilus sp. W345]